MTGERVHRCLAMRGDAVTAEHAQHGEQEDSHVEREGVVVHVPEVALEPLVPGRRVPPVHLRPARDAGTYVVPPRSSAE